LIHFYKRVEMHIQTDRVADATIQLDETYYGGPKRIETDATVLDETYYGGPKKPEADSTQLDVTYYGGPKRRRADFSGNDSGLLAQDDKKVCLDEDKNSSGSYRILKSLEDFEKTYNFGNIPNPSDDEESVKEKSNSLYRLIEDSFLHEEESGTATVEAGVWVLCTNCEDDYLAINKCKDCDDSLLCEPCTSAHRRVKLTKGHAVSSRDLPVEDPIEVVEKMIYWVDPFWRDYCLKKLGPEDGDLSNLTGAVVWTDRLRYSLNQAQTRIVAEENGGSIRSIEAKVTAELKTFINQILAEPEIGEHLVTKLCYLTSCLIDRGLLEGKWLVVESTINSLASLLNNNKQGDVLKCCLLAVRSLVKDVGHSKATFTMLKLKLLEEPLENTLNNFDSLVKSDCFPQDAEAVRELVREILSIFTEYFKVDTEAETSSLY